MTIRGKIERVVMQPSFTSRQGQVWDKITALLTFTGDSGYMESMAVEVVRRSEEREDVTAWTYPIFAWTEPIEVELSVSHQAREYNGKYYQDIKARGCVVL